MIIFCIYFFLGSKIVNLTKKREASNNISYNLTNIHWTPKGDRIKTKWGNNLDPTNIWKEYPRPQLEGKEWINLNGFWLYSISEIGMTKPKKVDGTILIPFPIESSLSGVMKNFTENQIISAAITMAIFLFMLFVMHKRTHTYLPNKYQNNKQSRL